MSCHLFVRVSDEHESLCYLSTFYFGYVLIYIFLFLSDVISVILLML